MVSVWTFLELLLGAGLLAWGADRFVESSSEIATRFNVSRLVVGILLVGFGTSFPEWIVSTIAATHHKAEIAIGNVVGSNTANIGLVLGLALLIAPIQVNARLVKREFPILMLVSLIAGALIWNGFLSRWDGVGLLLLLCLQIVWTFRSARSEDREKASELANQYLHGMSLKSMVLWWFLGLGFLFLGSECLVDSAVTIAEWLGMSELVIGLTIVTLGTSLPELAATVVSARRNEHDIALGHLVGSNIFNTLAVLAMPALIAPSALNPALLSRDYPVMIGFIAFLWFSTAFLLRQGRLSRWLGAAFLLGYIAYIASLVFSG